MNIRVLSIPLLFLALGSAAPSRSDDLSAAAIFERALRAYQEAAALEDTLALTIELPGAEPGQRLIRYGMGRGTDVYLDIVGVRRVVALGDQLYVESPGVPSRYLETAFSGDLGEALDLIAGESEVAGLTFRISGLWEPPQVALRSGKRPEQVLDAFRLTPLLGKLAIAGAGRLQNGRGETRYEVRLEAENGHCLARFDPETGFLAEVEYEIGLPEDVADRPIRARGTYSPKPLDSAEGLIHFDPGSRTRVVDRRELRNPSPDLPGPSAEVATSIGLEEALVPPEKLAEGVAARRVLLVGEEHLVREPQVFLIDLLERLGDRPAVLLVELPADIQFEIDGYLAGCDETALQSIFRGRQILQLQILFRWVCAHREKVPKVLAMDEPLVEILLKRMFLSDTRNETMARAIVGEYRADPAVRIVAYAGQLHMTLGGRYRVDRPSRQPAGSRILGLGIPRSDVATILLSGEGKFPLQAVWSEPGVLPMSGKAADIPFSYFFDYPIFGVETGAELFDYFVQLGPLTSIEIE